MKPITLDFTFWAKHRRLERITVLNPEDAIANIKELLKSKDVSGVQMTVEKSFEGEEGF